MQTKRQTYQSSINVKPVALDQFTCSQILMAYEALSRILLAKAKTQQKRIFIELEPNQKCLMLGLGIVFFNDRSSAYFKRIANNPIYLPVEDDHLQIAEKKYLRNTSLELIKAAGMLISTKSGLFDVLYLWETFAIDEAREILNYHCNASGFNLAEDDKLDAIIQTSLCRNGLAKTASYIHDSVCRTNSNAIKMPQIKSLATDCIVNNLEFWVEDPRARKHDIKSYNRSDELLHETSVVALFSRLFLTVNGADYFFDPISSSSLI